ncbi:RNA polymerase sigma factor [Actinomadura sp. NEAU-AAG7]|uniref:RNA polymerase sigma factor n=1 Tax=Actinomadura sp. NEAU-AAG7 TaxID=2839640 RepID=UPI001BE48111|nr:RNA polymerase sigma factor [Actinomadura sp. NEAU-AAG7]MBT2208082.1 RNA polymerase sigma factor [Actinomadura sp. NEAU-AAG7]
MTSEPVTTAGRRPREGDERIVAVSLTEPETFGVLFDRYYDALRRYVARRLGPEAADDVAGETFLVAFRERGRYDPARGGVRPWLFGIATHLISRHRRLEATRYRTLARTPVEADDDALGRVDDKVSAEAARPALAGALAALARRDRHALLLVVWAGLSYQEAGEALGVPTGTVASRVNRARHKVRQALGGRDPLRDDRLDAEGDRDE